MTYRTHATERGFTLMEMILVIFIIGVLSTIVIAGLGSAREGARDDERVADLAQLQLALEQFYNACGRQYPQPTGSYLDGTENAGGACPTGVTLASFIDIPKDPSGTTNEYEYYVPVPGNAAYDYVLMAKMETSRRALQEDVDESDISTTVWTGTVPACDDDNGGSAPPFIYCIMP